MPDSRTTALAQPTKLGAYIALKLKDFSLFVIMCSVWCFYLCSSVLISLVDMFNVML
jgi:hypothetical protein